MLGNSVNLSNRDIYSNWLLVSSAVNKTHTILTQRHVDNRTCATRFVWEQFPLSDSLSPERGWIFREGICKLSLSLGAQSWNSIQTKMNKHFADWMPFACFCSTWVAWNQFREERVRVGLLFGLQVPLQDHFLWEFIPGFWFSVLLLCKSGSCTFRSQFK